MQSIEARNLSAARAYALLVGIVVPRPIAWITSTDSLGRVNAAPFSCYTFVCNNPPMIAVNIGRRGGAEKDTERNLRATGSFVVNVVTEELIAPMHESSREYAFGTSEPELLSLELVPSQRVGPPRIARSPIALECVLDRIIELGQAPNALVIGEVVVFHIADELLADGRIDVRRFRPLARLGGPLYARLGEIITMPSVGTPGPRTPR
ncbi:MAG TPA: flavin reductase family protein [Alphaproteobacteria bacterium]|nr:flavin reductase family protein [Alphaproteobacteria bacterium]